MYKRAYLNRLSYQALVALAKRHGIKIQDKPERETVIIKILAL